MTELRDAGESGTPTARRVSATIVGFVASVGLTVVWHSFGFVTRPAEPSYPFTQYLANSISIPFAVAFGAVAFVIGRLTVAARFVAIGMVLPFPLAMMIEIARDRTSHNLMPFEVLLYWVPAFAVAFAGAYLGRRSALRATRADSHSDR